MISLRRISILGPRVLNFGDFDDLNLSLIDLTVIPRYESFIMDNLYSSTLASLSIGGTFNGTIPQGITKISTLKSLRLSHTGITGTIPPEIFNLPKQIVGELNFENTLLQGTLPLQMGNLTIIDTFNIRNTTIGGTIPHEIICNTEIRNLILNSPNWLIPEECLKSTRSFCNLSYAYSWPHYICRANCQPEDSKN